MLDHLVTVGALLHRLIFSSLSVRVLVFSFVVVVRSLGEDLEFHLIVSQLRAFKDVAEVSGTD